VTTLVARLREGRPWRAWKRYGDARGSVLAAGVGYFAFFSIFPATALAFAVFGFFLRGHPELLGSITDQLNQNLPGFVRDAQHPDGIIVVQAPGATALTVTGVIAFLTLVLAGMGWLGAVRDGIRSVFGAPRSAGGMISTKLRDLGVLVTLGVGIAMSAVLTSAVGGAAGWIAGQLGVPGKGGILTIAGLSVSVLADTGLMLVLLRVVSGVVVPWREMLPGALVGGVGFSLLKISAAALLPRLTANPFFASFAIVVGLLIWLNLIARLTLISAAWAANDVDEHRGGELQSQVQSLSGESSGASPAAAVRDGLPTFGARSGDRAALVSGVVLGAAATAATGVLVRGLRSLTRLVRS